MGKIELLGKWNLEQETWQQDITNKQRGRSSAIGTYEDIINDPNEGINYIIIALGSRVEDHSKNYFDIKESQISVDKFLSYFSNRNNNIAIRTFLMDADAPIKEDAKLIARYIDELATKDTTASINLLGVSKCGTMAFYVPKYFNRLASFHKTNVYTIASPFNGTKMASPKIFYPEVKKLITSKIGDTKFAETVYRKLISVYEGISSNSHMDYDIAMPGGISEDKAHIYDPTFIRDIFNSDNVNAVRRLNSYQNFITGIDGNTLKEAIATANVTGVGLCLLDSLCFDEQSDGLVMTSSQHLVEEHLPDEKITTHRLKSTHHSVFSNERAINEIMYSVNKTIEAQTTSNKTYVKVSKTC